MARVLQFPVRFVMQPRYLAHYMHSDEAKRISAYG